MVPTNIICVSCSPNLLSQENKARKLAQQLNVPFTPASKQSNTTLLLVYTDNGLELQDISKNRKNPQTLLHVNFVRGKMGYRFAHEKTIKLPLAKAVGIKPGVRPTVFDATAGLGVDGFVLAALGCQVTMCERSAVLGALLFDGLERAKQSASTEKIVAHHIHFLNENSIHYLANTTNRFQSIYLDPMYPHSDQSALNRLSMRIIRDLVGDDLDAEELLFLSLTKALNRVVVKRPRSAPRIGDHKPSHVIKMKNSRFDVYMTFNE